MTSITMRMVSVQFEGQRQKQFVMLNHVITARERSTTGGYVFRVVARRKVPPCSAPQPGRGQGTPTCPTPSPPPARTRMGYPHPCPTPAARTRTGYTPMPRPTPPCPDPALPCPHPAPSWPGQDRVPPLPQPHSCPPTQARTKTRYLLPQTGNATDRVWPWLWPHAFSRRRTFLFFSVLKSPEIFCAAK